MLFYWSHIWTYLNSDLIEQGEYATYVEIHLPKIYNSQWYQHLCNIVKSSQFEAIVDIILVLNAAIIAIQDYPMLSGQDVATDPKYHDGYIDTVWESLETIFTVLYFVEAMLKITVYGWRTYSESGRNLYDFGITAIAVIASAYVYCKQFWSLYFPFLRMQAENLRSSSLFTKRPEWV